MSIEAWKLAFEIIALVAVGISVAAGAAALVLGNRINRAQTVQARTFDAELTTAKTELGKQQVRAANAEHDAAEAKATATNANNRTLALEADATNAKAAQQRVEIALEKQKEQTANAERDLAQLRQAVRDRHLSAVQRSELIKLLSGDPKGPIDITTILGDSEAVAFTAEVADVFKSSGWTIADNGPIQAVYVGGPPIGFGIIVRSSLTAPSYAARIQNAFFAVGFPIAGVENTSYPDTRVEIVIGHKPNPLSQPN